jgi:hypothetical protein
MSDTGRNIMAVRDEGRREAVLSRIKPGVFLSKIEDIPDELKIKNESELMTLATPTPTEFAMKKSLWDWFLAQESAGLAKDLEPVHIYGGVCSKQYFFSYFLNKPAKVAWLFSPPIDTETLIEEAFLFGLHRVRNDLLTMTINEKTAPTILKAFQYFADRKLGLLTQTINSKNLNVELKAGVDGMASVEDVSEKFKKIKEAMSKQIKDVSPKVDSE